MELTRKVIEELSGDDIIPEVSSLAKQLLAEMDKPKVWYRSKNDEYVYVCKNEKELLEQWDYKSYSRPFVVQFLYSYSFPHRINLQRLIEIGVIKDISSAPRGFQLISSSDFDNILKETQTDARIIID